MEETFPTGLDSSSFVCLALTKLWIYLPFVSLHASAICCIYTVNNIDRDRQGQKYEKKKKQTKKTSSDGKNIVSFTSSKHANEKDRLFYSKTGVCRGIHFYSKTGVCRGIHFFILNQNIDCGHKLEPPQ